MKKLLADHKIQNPDLRIFRGVNAVENHMQLNTIFPSYDPQIDVIGDPGNFLAPVIYRVSLYSGFKRKSQTYAWNVMDELLGEDSFDAFLSVDYQFSAILAGGPAIGKSSVAVYIARQYAKGSVLTAKPHCF